MARYKLRTSQFGIVSGIRQEVSDRIVSLAPGNLFAPEARKGHLFLLTEAVNESARGKEACDLVTKTITETYYADTTFSITASLRNALREANSKLYDYNFKAPHHQRTAVGLTCAVLRDADLYIAQVQPTQAYLAHKAQLRALPAYPAWDGTTATSAAMLRPNALGTSLYSEPEFFRNVVDVGDELVLCSSRIAQILGRTEAERMFCLVDAPSALEELYELVHRNGLAEAHVAMIELLPLVNTAQPPLSPEGIVERGKAAATVVGDWISDVTGNAALMVRRPGADESTAEAEEPQPTSALAEQPTLPSALEEIDPRDMNWLRERPRYRPRNTADVDTWPPSAYIGEGSLAPVLEAVLPRKSVDLTDQQPLPVDFAAIPQRDPLPPPTFGERLFRPLRELLAAILTLFANVGRRRRPSADPLPRFQTSRGLSYRRKRVNRLPILALLLIPLLAAGFYFYLEARALENAENRFEETIAVAVDHYEDAASLPDDQEALDALEDMETTLIALAESDLLDNDPARRARYQSLVSDAEDLRASIERTSLLREVELVMTLPTSDTIGRMLVTENDAGITTFAVGTASGNLYRQDAAAVEPELVIGDGTIIEPVYVMPVRSMVWRLDALAVIDDDQASSVYLQDPATNGWLINRLDGSEFWPTQPFPDIETFGGNLYIWIWGENASDQILKYNSGEFANLPQNWLTTPPPSDIGMQAAVDMAVDGNLYLLKPNGEILVFVQGAYSRTIPAPEISPPLTSARRMFVTEERASEFDPNQGHIFILDGLNQRVIEIDQQGTVIQQIRVAADADLRLAELVDLAVTAPGPAGRSLFLANGSRIYRTELPAPPPMRELRPASDPDGDAQAAPDPTPTP